MFAVTYAKFNTASAESRFFIATYSQAAAPTRNKIYPITGSLNAIKKLPMILTIVPIQPIILNPRNQKHNVRRGNNQGYKYVDNFHLFNLCFVDVVILHLLAVSTIDCKLYVDNF